MDTLTLPSLLSQLKVAISSARERSDESLQFHATFFHRHENKAQDVLMIWKGICFGDSKYLECPPADTLHFLLMIESIWFSAALICIEHIHSNHINGRTALYCISEIRLALNRLVREVTTKREINCMINNVQKLGEACIEPIMNSGSINANSFSSCLELLPTIADALHHLQRQLDDFATDFDDSDPLDDLICTIFLVEWDLSLLLPLSSILCELYSYLSKDNLVAFKNKLLKSVKDLQTQSEDFAGVIRVALRLFEQSNDVRWTYVLRVLYRAIPERSLATVEALLEQIFTQTVQVAQLLLCALEDTAVWLGRTVVTRSFLKKATIEGIVAEYDGVPEISHFDVRLALIIARAIYVSSCSTNNSGGSVSLNNISEIALPLLLSGSLVDGDSSCEQMVLEAHLSSRSVFMLVLCCVSLLLAQELRYKTYNSDSIATSVGSTLNQIIYSVSSPSAPSSSSGGWLGDARAQELLKCFLQLGAYPELPAACLALTNSWFEELRKEELRNKEEEEACDGEGGEDEQKENTVSTEARVVLGSGPELLCNMIQEVFRARQNLQPAVLMCLLKGIVSCSPGGVSARSNSVYHSQSQRTATSSSSSSSAPSSVAVAHQPESSSGSHSEVPDKLLPIHDLMQEVLARLCERHRTAVAKHVGVIQTQFGAVVHAPSLEVVQTFLCSLVSVCAESTPIFAVVHGHLLKQVQVADPHKVMSAVRVIVPLLFAVTPAQQAEVLGSLAHVLARASVFSREACVLLFRQLDLHAPPTVGTPHSTFIPRLQDIINLKLAACFSEVVVVDSKASSFGSRRKVQEILKVFNPSLCVLPQSGALTGSQVTEDIEHCVLLGWKLACMANQEESLQGAVCLAEQIIQFHGNASSSSVCIPGPSILQQMWGIVLYAGRGFHGATNLAEKSKATSVIPSNQQAMTSPAVTGIITATAAATPSNNNCSSSTSSTSSDARAVSTPATTSASTQQLITPASATRSPRAKEAERMSEPQVCELIVAYTALSAVLKCLVEASQLVAHQSTNEGTTDRDGEVYTRDEQGQLGSKDTFIPAIVSLAAVLDVLHQLLVEVTNISTIRQCQQYYQARLAGMPAFALPLAKGSNVTEYAVAPSVQLEAADANHVLCRAQHILSPGSEDEEEVCNALPLSTTMGVLIQLVNFVRDSADMLSQSSDIHISTALSATSYITVNPAPARSSSLKQEIHTEMLATLLLVYKTSCGVALEEGALQKQADFYRQYMKYIRKASGLAPPVARHSKRQKKSVHYGDLRDEEEADGRIDSDSDDDSFGDTDGARGQNDRGRGNRLAGFHISSLLPHRVLPALPPVLSSVDHDAVRSVYRPSDAGSKQYLPPRRVKMDVISSLAEESLAEDDTRDEHHDGSSLWQHSLLRASQKLRAEFKRWDIHFVEQQETSRENELSEEYCGRQQVPSGGGCIYSVLENKLSPSGLHTEVRTALFNVRSEVLAAICAVLSTRSMNSSSTAPAASIASVVARSLFNAQDMCKERSVEVDSVLQLASYFAGEVLQSMKHGILVRAFNAYMKIFQELHRTAEEAVFIAHNSLRLALHANVLNCESTSALLWQTLKHLHSALPQIISPVVQAALKYRETKYGLQDCGAVLLSIAHQRFAHKETYSSSAENSDNEGDDSSGSGVEDATAATRTRRNQKTSHRHRLDDSASESDNDSDGAGKGEDNCAETLAVPTAKTDSCAIIVTENVADLVARDVIKHMLSTFQMISKQPELLTSIACIICPNLSDPQDYVFLCAGQLCSSLFALFAETETVSDSEDITTTTTVFATTSSSKNRKRNGASPSSRSSSKTGHPTEAEASKEESKAFLIDNFSEARISQLLEVVIKILNQCTKECASLLKSALLLRKVTNFVARTNRLEQASRVVNTFDEWEEEDEESEEGARREANNTGSAEERKDTPDAVDIQLERLHAGKLSQQSTPSISMLFGLLSNVPTAHVANLQTWLIQRIKSCPKRPSKACVAIIKRTQQTCSVLDALWSQMFAIVKETDKKYHVEGLMNVKDQRLMKLWDAVQNPAVDRGVTLVQVQGKSLMGALGITAVSADSGDGSINVEGDGDVGDSEVETHRRMTHYRGRESIRLHGVAGVSRTSALSDHRLASMAAAARSGAKRSSSSRKQPQMLQSRNPVVAHWYTLDKYFDGDTFADLEGFLV